MKKRNIRIHYLLRAMLVIIILSMQISVLYAVENGYILPQSASEYLNEYDVASFSKQELNYARNEIFARHGRRFKSQELMDYFSTMDWYDGTIEPENFDDAVLNEYEQTNAVFLSNLEYGDNSEGYVLDQPGYDIYKVTENMKDESGIVAAAGANLTEDQAYHAVYQYLDDSIGMETVYNYSGFLTSSDHTNDEYVFWFRSYTSAHAYYYVNKYNGDVYESLENPIESVYEERTYIFNVFDEYDPAVDGITENTESVDYSVVKDFIFNFPEHGRDDYALPGRDEIYDEAGMIAWLESHGWTDYVNLYENSGAPDVGDPVWAYEAQNGEWKLSGRSYIEWHEKVDDDYSDGCSVGISIQCSEEDGDTVYEKCKDIVDDYFYYSYRDIKDEDYSTVWSGFFDEDSAARVMYDYNTMTITVRLNDSIQPNLYGVFWNGIPLQKDGVVLDIPVTYSTIPPQ